MVDIEEESLHDELLTSPPESGEEGEGTESEEEDEDDIIDIDPVVPPTLVLEPTFGTMRSRISSRTLAEEANESPTKRKIWRRESYDTFGHGRV